MRSIFSDQAAKISSTIIGFVAFVREAADIIRVIRDPTGEIPCYYTVSGRTVRISSSADWLLSGTGRSAELDVAEIMHHLLAHDLRLSRTCLQGVTELPRGHRLSIAGGRLQIDQLWDPWVFASRSEWIKASKAESVGALYETVDACVAARAGEFEHILIGVSGGLDSFIVAACLNNHHPRVTCFTLATSDPRGDERSWPQTPCSGLGLELIEESECLDRIDFTQSRSAHLPRPLARIFAQSNDDVQMR